MSDENDRRSAISGVGPIKGRGAVSNPAGRFETAETFSVDDGWGSLDALPVRPLTVVRNETVRSIISRNRSPDVPFEQSVNPYRGCEHGCIYCYARPSHSYLNLSPGLDFETRLFDKRNAAEQLQRELRAPGYVCKSITLGANTDAYQPLERERRTTRELLQVMRQFNQPVVVLTKGTLVERDIDILAPMADQGLAAVMMSITTLDGGLKRTLEPRAASPAARLRTVRRLTEAGIPTGVLVAPVIPVVTDHELESILAASAAHGADIARYILLRLPHEVKDLFGEWLQAHFPGKARHVMSLVHQSRGGKAYDSRYGYRMRGTGVFADMLAQRFAVACKRLGLRQSERHELDTSRFSVPAAAGDQLSLFS